MNGFDLIDLPGINVSRETVEMLKTYEQLVRKWNPTINLASKQSMAELWSRHIVDSAQIFPHIPEASKLCLDVGSGGGFPGIVLATISTALSQDRQFILVESDQRKATFLRQVIRSLKLKAEVRSDRIEALDKIGADFFTARALAPLSKLLVFAQQHLNPQGISIFPKGENHLEEIREAQKLFRFDYQLIQSVTDPKSAILKIHGIENV
ncbi:16S rRNA (guanine(527)-N(7))-methyltransferase RsmG [Pseudorhodobacter sp. W20_MBD10_FR17]|uniref:16S rRNA (guanine(527)-N(7))-methyltransferase RsmG n=1 Tax=Pseudorhodobacter sp. W20_MBD10_FR17 TaxID=3240266 RepID=UPI003F9B6E5A